jgi:shikimate dehydrogenase
MGSSDRFLLAAVMGWPIHQSRSPMLHNFWFAQHGLQGSYVPLAIAPERLEKALRALPSLNFAGCNLTIPLKQDAMKIVDEVDITAKKIGAMSCVVVRPDGSLSGSNNDWYGFVHNILEFIPDWSPAAGPVAVMGAGGGSRAVVWPDGTRRDGNQTVQPHPCAGADAREGVRGPDHRAAMGTPA